MSLMMPDGMALDPNRSSPSRTRSTSTPTSTTSSSSGNTSIQSYTGAGGSYIPVAGISSAQLSSSFGASRDGGSRSHKGIDIFAPTGTSVLAARGGTVMKVGDSGKGGLRVWVRDDEGMAHYYAHMNSIDVQKGQRVEAGARLGGVGQTGNARNTPPHLHYSVNRAVGPEDGLIDPYDYLTGAQAGDGPVRGASPSSAAMVANLMNPIGSSGGGQGAGGSSMDQPFFDPVMAETMRRLALDTEFGVLGLETQNRRLVNDFTILMGTDEAPGRIRRQFQQDAHRAAEGVAGQGFHGNRSGIMQNQMGRLAQNQTESLGMFQREFDRGREDIAREIANLEARAPLAGAEAVRGGAQAATGRVLDRLPF